MISRYIFEVYGVLREQMEEGEEGTLSQQSILDQLFHSETLEQMRELLLQYGGNVRDLIRLKNDSATIGMIQQVQKTIRERYSENLTINELAAQVYLTPTYLCLLFRQVTGTTINRYLTNVRMEKAKELLMDLSNKLYDVSTQWGYMNPSYFHSPGSSKYVGCLPSSTATGGCPGSEAGAPQDHGDLLQSPCQRQGDCFLLWGRRCERAGRLVSGGVHLLDVQVHSGLWNFQEGKSGPERPRKN